MLRLCSYNVEHFNRLFTQTDQMQGNATEQTRFDALRVIVLRMIDADSIGVVEASNTTGERRPKHLDQAGDLCWLRRATREPGDDRAAVQRGPRDRSHVRYKR
jgi:hypothetical protein